MKILVVGRGGREHSIVTHLAKSERIEEIYVAPGNAGMQAIATCIDINEMDIEGLVTFAKESAIDLTIVGPENPLNAGIADRFQQDNLAIFAPNKQAALLEGSKSFAKQFMKKYDIPTAEYKTFTDAQAAKAYIAKKGAPIVIKADGLAEGKGVVVAETVEQAYDAIDQMLIDQVFAEAGTKIVIEEFLDGKEFSLMAFVNKNHYYPMLPARDFKRAFDDDQGPNTGGMGSYAPVPDVTEETLSFTYREIIEKTVQGLIAEGISFTGILYAGLMITKDGPKVIEFNTRFGDPETQVVLPLLENDLLQVFLDVLAGKDPQLVWKNQVCVGVVVASTGYPRQYKTGVALPSLTPANNTFVMHAGTKIANGQVVSNGGRVLLTGAIGDNFELASSLVYHCLTPFEQHQDFFYRKDIGRQAKLSSLVKYGKIG